MSDCIERMRVLQELQKIGGCGAAPGTWSEGWDKAIDEAYNRILGLPAADVVPRPSWIPVSERLPEKWLDDAGNERRIKNEVQKETCCD